MVKYSFKEQPDMGLMLSLYHFTRKLTNYLKHSIHYRRSGSRSKPTDQGGKMEHYNHVMVTQLNLYISPPHK